jgi:hypothetical protein
MLKVALEVRWHIGQSKRSWLVALYLPSRHSAEIVQFGPWSQHCDCSLEIIVRLSERMGRISSCKAHLQPTRAQ